MTMNVLIAEILDRYQEQPHLLDPYLGKLSNIVSAYI